MENDILYLLLVGIQHAAVLAIVIEIAYIATRRPSRYQIEMLLLLVSTLIMLGGYSIEIFAQNIETAFVGAAIAYVGKPFALILALIFTAEFYGKAISNKTIFFLSAVGILFPIIIFTNGYTEGTGHHLYYATVGFELSQRYSPLVLTRGPLYFSYAIFLVVIFIWILYYLIATSKKSLHNDEPLKQINYLAITIVATIVGYIIYLFGITRGYDTTMTGVAIGAFSLSILFIKHKLFDTLTLAKDHALANASNGLIVFNDSDEIVYKNVIVDKYLEHIFTIEEFMNLNIGNHNIHKNNRVFDLKVSKIEQSGRTYGKNIEITEVTNEYLYNLRLENEVDERTKEIRKIQQAIVVAFAGLVEARDNSTGQHIQRMARNTELIAREMLNSNTHPQILSDEYIDVLVEVAPLHDIGKLIIPDSILQKPDKLSYQETIIMQTHAAEGANIIKQNLEGIESPIYLKLATNVARYHHERWDGTGYPDKLPGTKIPLSARIVSVADVYDAIRSERCYKPAMSREEATQVIKEGRGTQFDPDIVDAFLRIQTEIEKQY